MDEPIKIERNALDILESIVSLLSIVGVAVYLILAWNQIPDKIPGHYNALGEVNRWGNKSELIVLPIISVVMYGLITLIERYPQVWNTGVRITEENRAQVYRLLKSLIAVVKMFTLLVFASLTVISSSRPQAADVVSVRVSRAVFWHDCGFYRAAHAAEKGKPARLAEQGASEEDALFLFGHGGGLPGAPARAGKGNTCAGKR